MGNLKKKRKQAPCCLLELEKEPCFEEDCQSQSLDCNSVFSLQKDQAMTKVMNMWEMWQVVVLGNDLFLEGEEDEDKDPCERRPYKRVYQQNYRCHQAVLQVVENEQGDVE
jgi:hypothetical protein